MKIVIDTNILMSCLLNPHSTLGNILLHELTTDSKFAPYFLFVEIFDKKEKIIKYSRMNERELLELLFIVLREIEFVNVSQISAKSVTKAKELVQGIDEDDMEFVALTIETNALLLTGDKKLYKGLKERGFEDVINLNDLKEMLNT